MTEKKSLQFNVEGKWDEGYMFNVVLTLQNYPHPQGKKGVKYIKCQEQLGYLWVGGF